MEEFKYLIPEESIDASSLDVKSLRKIEGRLRDVFEKNDYEELILPTFEYVNLYKNLEVEEEHMFQFINHEGKRIALRSDFTVPIARLYNSSKTNNVKRYSYFGKVYRMQERHKGRSSEFFQAGVELIGLQGFKGDQECLSLMIESMNILGLEDLKLELGSAKFFNRIVELVDDKRIVEILKRKEMSSMKTFIEDKGITSPLKDLLMTLPISFGGIDVILEKKSIIKDQVLMDALNELEDLYNSVDSKMLSFDLSMVPSMEYYTGVMMKGYSYYSAEPIVSGGRYDELLNHFNAEHSAIGFGLHLNSILKALSKVGEKND